MNRRQRTAIQFLGQSCTPSPCRPGPKLTVRTGADQTVPLERYAAGNECATGSPGRTMQKKIAGQKLDLILAGHSHGGQVRIPLYGPLMLPFGVNQYDLGNAFRTAVCKSRDRLFLSQGSLQLPPRDYRVRDLIPPPIGRGSQGEPLAPLNRVPRQVGRKSSGHPLGRA